MTTDWWKRAEFNAVVDVRGPGRYERVTDVGLMDGFMKRGLFPGNESGHSEPVCATTLAARVYLPLILKRPR